MKMTSRSIQINKEKLAEALKEHKVSEADIETRDLGNGLVEAVGTTLIGDLLLSILLRGNGDYTPSHLSYRYR